MYFYKSRQVALRHHRHRGRWSRATGSDRGYDVDAWVGRSNGRDDDPRADASEPARPCAASAAPSAGCTAPTAALMGVCVATAACLYIPPLAELVGRRELVVSVHEWAGLALPVPVLVGLVSRGVPRRPAAG